MIDSELNSTPFDTFTTWLEEHIAHSHLKHPKACVLSTIGMDGAPNARNVALKEFRSPLLYITGDITSRKGLEIAHHPKVALTFWWEESNRQIRIQGEAKQIDNEQARLYFSQRNIEAQVVSTISPQGAVLDSFEALEEKFHNKLLKHKARPVEKPQNWGGYAIDPQRIEFMEFRLSRLHDRVLYTKVNDVWSARRLHP